MPTIGQITQALGQGPGEYRVFAETVADASANVETPFNTILFANAFETGGGGGTAHATAFDGFDGGTIQMAGTANEPAFVFAIGRR